jgi:Domain of unknown function (DUF4186)
MDEAIGSTTGSALKLSCKTSDCDRNLHAFRMSKKEGFFGKAGVCRNCGVALIDWHRVQSRNLWDVGHTFEALKREWIRHEYWHKKLNQRAINYALKKGRLGLQATVTNHIRKRLGTAHPFKGGGPTPWESNSPISYAQHAVAACCRLCMEEWHGIQTGRPLSSDEIQYLSQLIVLYIDDRVEGLSELGRPVSKVA